MRLGGDTAARQNALLDRIEARFRGKIRAEIARQMNAAAGIYAETGVVAPLYGHRDRIEAIYAEMAEASIRIFGFRVWEMAGRKGIARPERKSFAATMLNLARQYVGLEAIRRRITQVAETTREQIINAVSLGYRDGLGQSGVAKLIRGSVPGLSSHRAAVIARTEAHGAANYGAHGAAVETGLDLRKEWIAAEDERTRPEHDAMNGRVIGMAERFDFGDYTLAYPGDPSGPPEGIINCRCALGYVME